MSIMLIFLVVVPASISIATLTRNTKDSQLIEGAEQNESKIYNTTGPFRMTVVDVFDIKGRGLVVTGKIQQGAIYTGDHIILTSADHGEQTIIVEAIEMFHKEHPSATAGQRVGLVISGSDRIQSGDTLSS